MEIAFTEQFQIFIEKPKKILWNLGNKLLHLWNLIKKYI